MSDKVKCADCGLLAIANSATGEIFEVGLDQRRHGHLANQYRRTPLCCASVDIEKDMKGHAAEEVVRIVNLERSCDKFFKWHMGFHPKEHLEMMFQEELRKIADQQRDRDRHWEEEVREKDQRWQEEQRRLDLERQEKQRVIDSEREEKRRNDDLAREEKRRSDDLALQRKNRDSDRLWSVGMAVFVGMVALLFGLIQLLMARSIK